MFPSVYMSLEEAATAHYLFNNLPSDSEDDEDDLTTSPSISTSSSHAPPQPQQQPSSSSTSNLDHDDDELLDDTPHLPTVPVATPSLSKAAVAARARARLEATDEQDDVDLEGEGVEIEVDEEEGGETKKEREFPGGRPRSIVRHSVASLDSPSFDLVTSNLNLLLQDGTSLETSLGAIQRPSTYFYDSHSISS
ncbi:hypothetical protein BDY24DRAFT_400536 [Mrakia frigida]|uniref:uncharacterized protein n=1 Tax=Mrakia frigida TaxID=29902 RepID=UPI003FCC157C